MTGREGDGGGLENFERLLLVSCLRVVLELLA